MSQHQEPLTAPTPLSNDLLTLDQAITRSEMVATLHREAGRPAQAARAQQMADWLRELQTLRAAMNMEPARVTG
jgi:hypothetical protein